MLQSVDNACLHLTIIALHYSTLMETNPDSKTTRSLFICFVGLQNEYVCLFICFVGLQNEYVLFF